MSDQTSLGLREGDPAPDFDLPATGGKRVSLAALSGKPFVLYLYPKADTTGCTQEARDFEAALGALGRKAPVVIGLSRDPVAAIEKFAGKAGLSFPLATDLEGGVVSAYGSWVEKSMYGRTYMGIDRSTFVIGADGRIVRIWRKVKVPGHVAEVMKESVLS